MEWDPQRLEGGGSGRSITMVMVGFPTAMVFIDNLKGTWLGKGKLFTMELTLTAAVQLCSASGWTPQARDSPPADNNTSSRETSGPACTPFARCKFVWVLGTADWIEA